MAAEILPRSVSLGNSAILHRSRLRDFPTAHQKKNASLKLGEAFLRSKSRSCLRTKITGSYPKLAVLDAGHSVSPG